METVLRADLIVPRRGGLFHIGNAISYGMRLVSQMGSSPYTTRTGSGSSVTLLPSYFGGTLDISTSTGLSEGFSVYFPSGTDMSLHMTGLNSDSPREGDSLVLTVINNTSLNGKFVLTDAINDSQAPLNDSGEIVLVARSAVNISCTIAGTAPNWRARYVLLAGGAGSGGGGFAAYDDMGDFPVTGDTSVVYGARDTNKAYYWTTKTALGYDWTVGSGGDFASLSAALASASVVNGNKIKLLNGTYTLTSTLTINKQVGIFGESRAGAIITSAGGAGDPTTLITVSTDNVCLRDLTIKHIKTTNTSVETALNVTGGGSPATRVSNFIMENCQLEYMEFGIQVRGESYKINGNTIAYTGPNNSTRRAICVYAVHGNCFLTNNVFENNASTGNLRAICPSSSAANDIFDGTLAIEDNSHVGNVYHFFIQDGFLSATPTYKIYFKRNTISEIGAFCILYGGSNFGDILDQVVAENNSISNASGKGLVAVDGPVSSGFRTSSLPLHYSGNTLASGSLRTDWALATGASSNSCCYNNGEGGVVLSGVSVTQDAVIPTTPTAQVTPNIDPISVTAYYELSPPNTMQKESFLLGAGDLVYKDLTVLALPSTIIAFVNRDAIHESVDYSVSTVSGKTRLTWIGNLASGQPEALIAGDRISVTYQY